MVLEQLTSSLSLGTPSVTLVLLLTPVLWNVSRTASPLAVTMFLVPATVRSYTYSCVDGQHSMQVIGSPRKHRFLFFDATRRP